MLISNAEGRRLFESMIESGKITVRETEPDVNTAIDMYLEIRKVLNPSGKEVIEDLLRRKYKIVVK
ncbi:TPA: hypothetical protein DCQ19_00835 [Candidatus Shapirobacteria bacterium]|nr:hypothetical protein [Candidatus Shapirobacteria bacterium]